MEMLVGLSNIAVYSAMAIYVLAFIAFTLDLAQRSAQPSSAQKLSVGVGRPGSVPAEGKIDEQAGKASWAKPAVALTVVAWSLHAASVVLRGFAAGYAPWSNLYGFALTATALIVGVYLAMQMWQDVRYLGAFIVGFALLFLGVVNVNFYVDVVPLPPALQSVWLVIHVFVASLGTAFFALGAGLSVMQILQSRREMGARSPRFLKTLPSAEQLEALAYRIMLVGFVLWTFTLIAGAIWAQRAWGRYWGWDTKEVWTFIIWTIYAGYIHARATRGWRGPRSAVLAIIGFVSVIFNFTVVNLFFKGLHSYSGLTTN